LLFSEDLRSESPVWNLHFFMFSKRSFIYVSWKLVLLPPSIARALGTFFPCRIGRWRTRRGEFWWKFQRSFARLCCEKLFTVSQNTSFQNEVRFSEWMILFRLDSVFLCLCFHAPRMGVQ
jgi:hypothetical protein